WFNRSFLVLRRIDWTTPANILEQIIRYEAVHEIKNWDDLRNRLASRDRRCYGFFHPQLTDEPLIFVEVALTEAIPEAIAPLLAPAINETLAALDRPDWHENEDTAERVRAVLMPLAAHYFLKVRDARGRLVDSVARFHLGNGARLEQLDFLGDVSEKGLQQA